MPSAAAMELGRALVRVRLARRTFATAGMVCGVRGRAFRRPIPAQRSTSTVGHSRCAVSCSWATIFAGSSRSHRCCTSRGPAAYGASPISGQRPSTLPVGEVLLSSAQLDQGRLPSDTTVWLRAR